MYKCVCLAGQQMSGQLVQMCIYRQQLFRQVYVWATNERLTCRSVYVSATTGRAKWNPTLELLHNSGLCRFRNNPKLCFKSTTIFELKLE